MGKEAHHIYLVYFNPVRLVLPFCRVSTLKKLTIAFLLLLLVGYFLPLSSVNTLKKLTIAISFILQFGYFTTTPPPPPAG